MTKDLEILAASQWDETSRAVELPWFHVGQLLSGDLILQNLQKLRIGSPTCANIDGEYLLRHDVLRHHKSVNWGQQVGAIATTRNIMHLRNVTSQNYNILQPEIFLHS